MRPFQVDDTFYTKLNVPPDKEYAKKFKLQYICFKSKTSSTLTQSILDKETPAWHLLRSVDIHTNVPISALIGFEGNCKPTTVSREYFRSLDAGSGLSSPAEQFRSNHEGQG